MLGLAKAEARLAMFVLLCLRDALLPSGCPQEFLYETNLQGKPIYTIGISAGAAFATKVVKNFWGEQFGGIIKPEGIISGAFILRSLVLLPAVE
jgi:hypothetical protein